MRIIGNDPSVPRQTQEVASGTLPNGRPVVVNADGTVSVVAETSISQNLGSEQTFANSDVGSVSAAFDSSNNKFVIVYKDESNSNYGTAAVVTVSGDTLSFGTGVVFNSAFTDGMSVTFDSSNNKVVIVYPNWGSSGHGTAIVGTVSGTSISFGTAVKYESGGNATYSDCVFDTSNNKVVISFVRSADSGYGNAIVGTVSGTSISFGSPTRFISAAPNDYMSLAFDSSNNKIILLYVVSGDANGYAIVGTVSGTSISFGSAVVYNSGTTSHFGITFDSTNNKAVLAYRDNSNSYYGTAIIGTVSGTSISFGSEVVFEAANTQNTSIGFDSNAGKVVISYQDGGNGQRGTLIVGTVSGTSISFGTAEVFHSAGAISGILAGTGTVFDSNVNKIVNFYRYGGDDRVGGVVFTNASTSQNLTSENYIGMSGGPAFQTGEAGSTGTAVSFESGVTTLSHVAFDSSNNKVVIAYSDGADSDKGKAIVGTVSGTSISFGSIVVFEGGGTANIDCVFDSSNNKIVIVYSDAGDSGRSKGIVGTVSGTSISFGSPTQFNSGANYAYDVAAAFDNSNNKVVVAYRDNGNSSYGTAAVGTVSGTSISFGTPVVYESANASQNAVVFDSSNNKVAIAFKDGGNSDHGTAIVGTVSGTSISFGSAVVFNAGETSQIVGAFDSSNNKVVLAYRDNGNSDQGTAIVGTVSGTSISFGSEVIFNAANTQGTSAVFDTNANKVLISYEDRGDSDIGKFIVGTVSGTSISFDTETAFSGSNAVFQTGAAFDSNANKVVIAYANDTHSDDRGEAVVTNISTIATTRGQVADGGHALVDTQGAISDNQIGLTPAQSYFVQNDGTLSTTAADPSVFAGTAVSATKLIVKG
jgi:hypothetical protein